MVFHTLALVALSLLPYLCTALDSQGFLRLHKREKGLAPLYGMEQETSIPNEYIVMFQPGHTLEQHFVTVGRNLSNTVRFREFDYGYRATLSDEILRTNVRTDPGVLLVETNRVVEYIRPVESYSSGSSDDDHFGTVNKSTTDKLRKREYTEAHSQHAPYGLQMLAGKGKLSTPISDDGQYSHVFGAGQGVRVYVLDTGIRISHKLFEGRAVNFGGLQPTDNSPYVNGEPMADENGHGTHVAGTIGGAKYGVATLVELINVKVLNRKGEGDLSMMAQAITDVTKEHRANKDKYKEFTWKFRGSLINMSLGGWGNAYALLYQLIDANEAGIAVYAAAGNEAKDSSNFYPCALPEVYCVGAVDRNYNFAKDYSNYGSVVKYLAPGSQILSLGHVNDNSVSTKTGTSMACPHVVGAAAIFVHWQGLINKQVDSYVWWNSLDGLISGVPSGTGTLLVNTGIHSPKKYPKEPFRWAGDYPVKNHEVNYLDSTATTLLTVASGMPLTGEDVTPYKTMLTIDIPDIGGLVTIPGDMTFIPTVTAPSATATSVPGGDAGQQIAIASYINPLGDPASWERLFAYDTKKVSVLVANVLNGPDYVVDNAWKSVIDRAASQGKKIIGYVRTGYLGVSHQQFTTRLGSHNLADWASQIEQDVDKWFELYGTSLGGIFFDEGWPECGPNNIYADLYASINNYTKRKYPGAFTVLNPGSPIAQCFENTMDTLMTFESSYETYKNSFVPNDWTPKDPRKIWHIIYKVPQDQIANIAALAWSRHSGLLEITDDDQPNPYDNLPNAAYMQAVIGAVPGGKPRIDSPARVTGSYVAGLPSNAVVSSSDYSSVTLTWPSVGNALGYAVYKNGAQVLELPASLTRATVGMLEPGSSGITFEVRTILASSSGGSSRLITTSTRSLPVNGTIANVGFTQNGNTVIYKADVLVPYAFVRLFIGIKQPDIGIGRGWPIQKPGVDAQGTAHHQIVNYLVEGNDFYSGFYKYTGAWYETTSANADWSWSSIGVAPQSQSGYTYTWNVPFAGTDAVASEYVIQCQGYAPYKNVFMGTLRHYSTSPW